MSRNVAAFSCCTKEKEVWWHKVIHYVYLLLDPSAQYRSCAIAFKINDGKEGYYNIKHGNMRQSLEVECKIINNTRFAVIHHDSEALTHVAGKESPCSFR